MTVDFDVFGMSDEDLTKATIPETPVVKDETKPDESTPTEEQPVGTEETPTEAAAPPGQEDTQEAPGTAQEQPSEQAPTETAPEVAQPQEAAPEAAQAKPEQTKVEADKNKNIPPKTGEDTKFKSFYEKLTAPIKGGGTAVQITSADEAIALMQKGLDYTRKTQEIAKDRKYILMLSQAGLLDEGKLDHLIAIAKGDKTALARFFKDSKIDPIEIDTKEGDNYKPGAHVVSDSHANLDTAIKDLEGIDGGKETLGEINTWDKASKEILWNQPSLLKQMHEYRQSGVYKTIADEVRRLKALGQVPVETPFLYAFKEVGNQLQAQGKLGGNTNAAPRPPVVASGKTPVPVARRPASPSPASKGNAQVKAAAATRTTPTKTQVSVPNIMDMSDDEFRKLKF